MDITLDQARAFDAIARLGSFARAATELKKGHTGVIYLIKTLEEKLGFHLLDRSKYRTRLTPTGERIWAECRKLLEAERGLLQTCAQIASGWEPSFKVVMDGILPVQPSVALLTQLTGRGIPTRISIFTEYLSGVEERFEAEHADLMLSMVPSGQGHLKRILLAPVRAHLVASTRHALTQSARCWTQRELREHVLVTVRGSDERLRLSTVGLDPCSTVHLGDFNAKKAAIVAGVGFGWLPDHLTRDEILQGQLKVLTWEKPNEHVYVPTLYYRGEQNLGRVGKIFLEELLQVMGCAPPSPELSTPRPIRPSAPEDLI